MESTPSAATMVKRMLEGSALRYLIVGSLNTVIGYVLFLVGIKLGLSHQAALALSYAIAVIHSFAWNRLWTFRAAGPVWAQLPKFLAVTGVTYVINALLLDVLVHRGFAPALAQIGCLFVTTLVGFGGHRLWSFRQR